MSSIRGVINVWFNLITKKYSYKFNLLKEQSYFQIYNLPCYFFKNNYIYLESYNINLLEDQSIYFEKIDSLVVQNRKYNEDYVYSKLSNCFYFKIIPEFFLPSNIQLFIFRSLFLKHFFFLSSLYLLRLAPFRVSVRKLALRYFYNRKLHYYFSQNTNNNFITSITSEKNFDVESKQLTCFNVIDFLYFDFLIFV